MSSRRYPVAERYEELESSYYPSSTRHATRDYDEIDVDIRRDSGRDMTFLREDFGRSSNAGPLVIRPKPRARSVDREEVIVRRREDRDRNRRGGGREEELDVTIRREDDLRPRRRKEVFEEDIEIKREDYRRPSRAVEREREDVIFRRGESERRSAPRGREVDYEVDIRRKEFDRRGRRVDDSEEVQIQTRSHSRPRPMQRPPPAVQDDAEVIIRRRRGERSISPNSSISHRPIRNEEEIIIRRREERSPTPPPPAPLEPIIRPPIRQEIHQEIITHHRHFDHGVERARSRSPLPPPPPRRSVDETIEVDIRRRGRGGSRVEEDIVIDSSNTRSRENREVDISTRARSISAGRSAISARRVREDDFSEEADYYNRVAMDRAYVGEAYDGATKKWELVDVPPGTRRVRMDGAGGGSQDITWQKYNGVRRSKFIAGEREYDTGFGVPDQPRVEASSAPPPVQRPTDKWTEITKDLVIKEAIQRMGYEFEETEYFFYVMDYLRYEDVLQLVQLSDDIRRDRKRRMRELEWEMEEMRLREEERDRRLREEEREREAARRYGYDDRVYEREIVIDRRR